LFKLPIGSTRYDIGAASRCRVDRQHSTPG
jgi:hypothetical protein